MKVGESVRIEYIRPGKEITQYEEDFVSQDDICLRTYKSLPDDIVEHLSRALHTQGLIAADQRAAIITKTYFFAEPFDLLEFRERDRTLIGYYSDIGEPVLKLGPGRFQMTDLFLDTWLHPNGQLIELDWDEFEEALEKKVITPAQAELARQTMQRLIRETAEGIYPSKYLDHFDPLK